MRLGGFMIAAENCGKVAERGKPRSISDAQQVFPFANVALEAHVFSDQECRDDTALDLPDLSALRTLADTPVGTSKGNESA